VGSQSLACLSCHDSNQAYSVGRTSADHPFGVPYRGAKGVGLQNFAAMTRESESIAPFRVAQHLLSLEDFRDVSQGTVEGRTIFWVSSRGVTVRRTRSDLPLYARSTGDPLLEGDLSVPHIECSSCHDPHTKNDAFLRVSASGSQLCLTCHDK
jgi:predicted CXXCH cytochrome family protein